MSAAKKTPYTPRKSALDVKKPCAYPGSLMICGAAGMQKEIDRLCPNEGNRRRETLLLTAAWSEDCGRRTTRKSEVTAAAASAIQKTSRRFGNQVRRNGKTVTGLSRAKCTMAKTCHWMLTVGLFVVVEGAP